MAVCSGLTQEKSAPCLRRVPPECERGRPLINHLKHSLNCQSPGCENMLLSSKYLKPKWVVLFLLIAIKCT